MLSYPSPLQLKQSLNYKGFWKQANSFAISASSAEGREAHHQGCSGWDYHKLIQRNHYGSSVRIIDFRFLTNPLFI